MTIWMAERRVHELSLAAGAALVFGLAAAAQPKLTLGAAVAVGILLLAFRAPVANLTLLLLLTCVVPYGVQNQFSVGGGGVDSPGLFLSDLVLSAGLLSALGVLVRMPLDRRRLAYASMLVLFLGLSLVQFLHGMRVNGDLSRIGYEYRILLGFGSFFLALPLLAHPRSRRRLIIGLAGVGIALGAWGMVQWFGHVSFGGDVGVRPGVLLTTAGTGQLQGGEFAYPAAVVLFLAALTLGNVRSTASRIALTVGLVLNAAGCLLTFERSFWAAGLLGLGVVLVLTRGQEKLKIAMLLLTAGLIGVGSLALVAPKQLKTAEERAFSVADLGQDQSVRYRLVESRFVLDRIHAHPVTGSGLGAEIFWGRPWQQVTPKSYAFSHNGYLWLAWKVGVPTAALLVLLLVGAVLLPAPRNDDRLTRALRDGSRGAIAGLLVATVTFSTFNELSITSAIGLLLALSVCPAPASRAAGKAARPSGRTWTERQAQGRATPIRQAARPLA